MKIILLLVAAAAITLSGCGSDGDSAADSRAASPTSAPSLPPPVSSPADDPDQNTIDEALTGRTTEEAEAAATAAGYTVRVVSVDGEPKMTTMDYRTNRINLEIEDDVVTRAFVG